MSYGDRGDRKNSCGPWWSSGEGVRLIMTALFQIQVLTMIYLYFRDDWGRLYCEVVALDAQKFRNSSDQYKHHIIRRELNKVRQYGSVF